MSIPYHPDTDAVPDMTDHRVADLRARLAAAEAREARLVGAVRRVLVVNAADCGTPQDAIARDRAMRALAEAERAADGSALAQAIEGVLDTQDKGPAELLRALRKLRDAWGQR